MVTYRTNITMKFFYYLIILFLFFLNSCNLQNNNSDEELKNNTLKTNRFNIHYRLTPYDTMDIRFFYPYEIFFDINIDSTKEIDLVSVDSVKVMYREYNAYLSCIYQGNTYKMYVYKNDWIQEKGFKLGGYNETNYIGGYFIDFPLFDSLYSKKQFTSFINDFSENAVFYIYTRKNNHLDSIKLTKDSLKFGTILGEERTNLKTNMHQIGYPDSIHMKDKSVWTVDIGVY